MSHLHVRRYRADDDDPELVFGPYTGSVQDLNPEPESDDGLVDVNGNPLPRTPPVRRPLGFRPPSECE